MTIRKAVIPAAGLGTRFLPATKSMPKEMLPVIDKPIIQFVVEEAIASGIEDILFVTGRGKRAIEDYFDASPELEGHLERNGKLSLLKEVQDISSLADIHYIRQKEPKGLGDAIAKAEKHIGDEPFAVMLGDDIIRSKIPCLRQLIDLSDRYEASIIAVEQVPDEKISDYGIIQGRKINSSLYMVEDIVEKPEPALAPSNIGAVGRYVFTPQIFDCIRGTDPGKGGEIQLTDAIRKLLHHQDVYAYRFQGTRYDAGDKIGYIKSIIDFALERDELREGVIQHLKISI
jgi:UTP--glucose-1-phosphate uridylyltransferase